MFEAPTFERQVSKECVFITEFRLTNSTQNTADEDCPGGQKNRIRKRRWMQKTFQLPEGELMSFENFIFIYGKGPGAKNI